MKEFPEVHDLIQRDIDGRLSTDEKSRLAAILERDSVAREEHRRLSRLSDLLAGLPKEDAPSHLSAKVLREIRARRSPRPVWGFWPGGRLALGYSYAAAAGAALAILGVHLFTGGRAFGPDPFDRNAAATIGSPAQRGLLSYKTLDGSFALEVEPPADVPTDVVLSYDPEALELIGFSNRSGGVDRLEADGGTVRWTQDRPQRVTVLLAPRRPGGSRVEVRYSGVGATGGSGSLELPGLN